MSQEAGQRVNEVGMVALVVLDQRAEDLIGEAIELGGVGHVEQEAIDAQVFEGHYVAENYLPEKLRGQRFFRPSDSGYERELADRLRALRKQAGLDEDLDR